jgi:hypothetical protein
MTLQDTDGIKARRRPATLVVELLATVPGTARAPGGIDRPLSSALRLLHARPRERFARAGGQSFVIALLLAGGDVATQRSTTAASGPYNASCQVVRALGSGAQRGAPDDRSRDSMSLDADGSSAARIDRNYKHPRLRSSGSSAFKPGPSSPIDPTAQAALPQGQEVASAGSRQGEPRTPAAIPAPRSSTSLMNTLMLTGVGLLLFVLAAIVRRTSRS